MEWRCGVVCSVSEWKCNGVYICGVGGVLYEVCCMR